MFQNVAVVPESLEVIFYAAVLVLRDQIEVFKSIAQSMRSGGVYFWPQNLKTQSLILFILGRHAYISELGLYLR